MAIIILVLIHFSQWQRWTGLIADPDGRVIGHYSSFETCRNQVEKVGGWCGKGCNEYPGGPVADCKPLIKAQKLK
jgi:hypothetical protein